MPLLGLSCMFSLGIFWLCVFSFYNMPVFLCFILFFFCQQLPHTNPEFNNCSFKFTKSSNAYMLVYVRESDKDKIICDVDEKDIAEHVRVRCLIHWCYTFLGLSYICYLSMVILKILSPLLCDNPLLF